MQYDIGRIIRGPEGRPAGFSTWTPKERQERREKVNAALALVRRLRGLYRQQTLAVRQLEERLKADLRNLE